MRQKQSITSVQDQIRPIRVYALSLGVGIAFATVSASLEHRTPQDQKASAASDLSTRMADGKQWTTSNLDVDVAPSYCYDDADANCRRYGRLYTWESAQRGCRSLGEGWRLPADDEWRQLAKHSGGHGDGSKDSGNAAFKLLSTGGRSGFNALLGGNRDANDGKYARLEAHGFYWTASENGSRAVFYNFARGRQALYRQGEGEKQMAISARCVKE